LQLNRQLRTIAAKRGAGSQTIIESLLATALYALALHNEADIHEALGQGERAEAIRQRNERVFELHKSFLLNRTMDTEATRARSTYQYLQHTNYVDPAPMRAAEYALIEQAALVGLLTAVLIVALLAVLCTGISLLRRRTARPYLLFVGWGPIGRICLLAIVMPLAVYVLYTRLAPFSSQRFGWWYAEDRIALELVTLGLVIVGLLVGLTYRAVRRRAAEAGLEVPRPLRRPDRRVFVTIAALLGAVIIVYLAAWEIVHLVPRWTEWVNTWELQHYPGWYIAGAAVLVAAVWFIREAVYVLRLRGNLAAFRRTLIRSSIGVYAAAIILVGAICGVTLRRVEAVHVSHLTGNAYVGIDNELELSSLRDLRAWFIQHHQELTAADE
ncbi:MAG: hypothetical protein GX591_15250, partial [Planctomycetes bacterium]|nr:hypothetical protein [Planctomycetota bacterium]